MDKIEGNKDACGLLFPTDRNDHSITDNEGCIKTGCHDKHVFVNEQTGKMIEWEYDYGCDCGCTDDIENNSNDVCIIYSEIITPKQ